MRTVLVVLHVAPGVVGLLAGLFALRPPRSGDGQTYWRRLYAGCVGALPVGLILLIAFDWSSLDGTGRLVFVGLAGLGVVMVGRLALAWRAARSGRAGWQERYIGHVFFTYVSLWVGFLIVPALNSPAPVVAVMLVVVTVPIVGIVLLSRYKRRSLMA